MQFMCNGVAAVKSLLNTLPTNDEAEALTMVATYCLKLNYIYSKMITSLRNAYFIRCFAAVGGHQINGNGSENQGYFKINQ